MRVLLANSFFYPAVGGIENYLLNLGRVLQRMGHLVSVLARQHLPDLPVMDQLSGIDIRRYPYREWSPPGSLFNLRRECQAAATAMRTILAKMSFDLIITRDLPTLYAFHNLHSPCPAGLHVLAAVYPLYQNAVGSRMSATMLGRAFSHCEHEFNIRVGGIMERRLLSHCERVVVLSHAKSREVSTFYKLVPRMLAVVPPGVDTSYYRPAIDSEKMLLRSKLGLSADAFVVLYVGRPSREKNPLGLIEAFAQLDPSSRAFLVFVGPFPDDFLPQSYVERLRGRILFPGAIPEPVDYYRAADAFVLPSLTEGFGQVLLEAMAAGLPCIAFRCPVGSALLANEEVIDHEQTGFLVEYGRPKRLADAITLLLRDPASTRRMGERARLKCVESFAWSITAKRLLELGYISQ